VRNTKGMQFGGLIDLGNKALSLHLQQKKANSFQVIRHFYFNERMAAFLGGFEVGKHYFT
jgi:hypothetical protein